MHPILAQAKSIAREIAPPVVRRMWRRARAGVRREWIYQPEGWAIVDAKLTGWDVEGVVQAEIARWPAFISMLSAPGPVGTSHETLSIGSANLASHNTHTCFAYVLARASRQRNAASMLDWGGGIGHYYQLARALVPELSLAYTCKDLPRMVRAGRQLQPALRFVDTEAEALDRKYDLVMASGSLQYSRDWQRVVHALADATSGPLYLTRLPIVEEGASFVVRQRTQRYGYAAEYLAWCLSRTEFLDCVAGTGMRLEREFVIDETIVAAGAPDPVGCRGFLFQPA